MYQLCAFPITRSHTYPNTLMYTRTYTHSLTHMHTHANAFPMVHSICFCYSIFPSSFRRPWRRLKTLKSENVGVCQSHQQLETNLFSWSRTNDPETKSSFCAAASELITDRFQIQNSAQNEILNLEKIIYFVWSFEQTSTACSIWSWLNLALNMGPESQKPSGSLWNSTDSSSGHQHFEFSINKFICKENVSACVGSK